MENKRYVGEIDFLKFIMAVVIMFMHIAQLNVENVVLFKLGGFAVEFFFIVSGYFMCCSAEKSQESIENLGKETIGFLWKKFNSLKLPYFFVCIAYIGMWALSTGKKVVISNGLIVFLNDMLLNIFNCLMLFMSGTVNDNIVIKITWYISAMLLAMLFLYPMVRLWGQKFRLIVAPVVAIFGTGFVYMEQGQYKYITERVGFSTGGMWRAVIGICIGCMVFEFSEYIRELRLKKKTRILLSICDFGILAVVFYIFCFGDKTVGFMIPTLFFFLVSIIASKQNILSERFDNRLCKKLGSLSLFIYLLHAVARKFIYVYYPDISFKYATLSIVSITVVLVLVVSYVDSKLKKANSMQLDNFTAKDTEE